MSEEHKPVGYLEVEVGGHVERLMPLQAEVELVIEGNPKPLILSPETIRALRKRAKMTQKRLAEAIGVSRAEVSNWERDQARPRNREIIHRLVTLLAPEHTIPPDKAHLQVGDIVLDLADGTVEPIVVTRLRDRTPVVQACVRCSWPTLGT